jgi:hypothetical protein
MQKRFEFEFEDESASASGSLHDGLHFPQYTGDERLEVSTVDGVPMISANRDGLLMLAKLCAKMAMSDYEGGFHLHLSQDFNADLAEALILGRIR